jgi:hypothetical protein
MVATLGSFASSVATVSEELVAGRGQVLGVEDRADQRRQ